MHRRPWTSYIVVTLSPSLLVLTATLPSGDALIHRVLLGQAQSPVLTTPTFRTDASYVRVDVFATANGRPATDLTLDDFELFEDGKRQAIAQFEYVNVRAAAP